VGADSRDRMVRAAIELFGERGYAATSFADILERSAAPRGSIYHHFPGGKAELAAEALRRYTAASLGRLRRDATAGVDVMIGDFVRYAREVLVAGDCRQGCPIAGVALDVGPDDPLAGAVGEALAAWRWALAEAMRRDGAPAARADSLATLVVAGVEGALLLARAARDPGPLDDVGAELLNHVRTTLGDASRYGAR